MGFPRLIGVYVAFFACAGALLGRVVFDERMSMSTWVGLVLIVIGGLVMQTGRVSDADVRSGSEDQVAAISVSSAAGSTGFTRWWSKPASCERRRSSSCP